MKIPVFRLAIGVLCLAAAQTPPPLACNPNGIPTARKARYQELTRKLRASVHDKQELKDGFRLRIDSRKLAFADGAEWTGLERLCCPFFTFTLQTSGSESDWTLSLTGPPGTKELLAQMMSE